MFRRVLVPINGSGLASEALRIGERLAGLFRCELQALTLIEPGQITSGVEHIIGRQVASLQSRPKVDIRSMSSGVAEDIASEFDRVENTLIVMGTWGRGRSAGLVPNHAEEVLRLVGSPMIMLGPGVGTGAEWPTGPMLIAVGGSRFGETVVRPAAQLAKAISVEAQLVTVSESDRDRAATSPSSETDLSAGTAGLADLAAAVASVTGESTRHDVVHGHDPAREIADLGRRCNASLIAMSTHGRSGLNRLTSDSVTMDVVRHADCPVFVHRPPPPED